MYAGTTLIPLKWFDAWFGAHQKIDRLARRNLTQLVPTAAFPSRRLIAHFEGLGGPDGIKRKTPGKDEPWHFIDPFNSGDDKIVHIIEDHYRQLVQALRDKDSVRSAFEAAWLSHAIVDGLTPAHHYPYEAELIKLRNGEGNETRTSTKDKLLLPGDTLPKQLSNNWKMWGDRGLIATHFAFEWGVAAIIAPLRLKQSQPSVRDQKRVIAKGVTPLFLERARSIAKLRMYDEFYKSGWTPKLAKVVRKELAPTIVSTVTLVWYAACQEATSEQAA